MVHDVLIIGSGPAGYTAALYNARANLEPVVLAGHQSGGQLMITTDVENYPGFPDGILGPEMMDLFRKQAERFGAQIQDKQVTSVKLNLHPFEVFADSERFLAKTLIISTGASAKWLGLPSEVRFGGHGVSACATCDGFFFRNKAVAVVGGGDTAMEEADYLTRHAAKVYLIHRRHEFRASQIMQDRVLNNPKVEVRWNSMIEEIVGEETPHKKVVGVRIIDLVEDKKSEITLDGVFIAIGHKPNSDLFKGVLDMDDVGYIRTLPHSTKTNVDGVLAAGDVADSVYRQAITAAGSGCMAAIDAEHWLASHSSH